ncbi:MAG: hypothetical protein HOA17_07715 [Candidatus Melainabacteria bacterium]|jgi:hypothetical protein|nr:hypothetical protein [Candidatus Melainabacteria bacterium]
MKSTLKLIAILLVVLCSSTACIDIKKMIGLDTSIVDFPPGDYPGTARLITNGEAAEVAELIKVTFLPKSMDLKDGIGVLQMQNNSQRFFWRTDGNNTDSWNVLFHKDQNLYTSLEESFEFDGLIKATEIQNILEGRLHINNSSVIRDYFIEGSQVFPPSIIPGKDALEVKAGDEFSINVAKIGDDEEAIKVFYKSAETKKLEKMEILKLARNDEGIQLFFATDKKMKKGAYTLYFERGAEYKSNTISFTVI